MLFADKPSFLLIMQKKNYQLVSSSESLPLKARPIIRREYQARLLRLYQPDRAKFALFRFFPKRGYSEVNNCASQLTS